MSIPQHPPHKATQWFLSWPLRYGLAGVLLLLAIVAVSLQQCQSPDSQLFMGLRPDASYVGATACQSCHEEIYKTYVQTGMGRSLYRPDPKDKIEQFGPEAVVYDKHTRYYYRPYWRADSFYIMEYRLGPAGDTVHKRTEVVDYIIGSGHQTRSYLIQRQGYLYEAPITWYVSKQLWDLSPGYHNGYNSRFDREIGPSCLNCHNAYSWPEPGTLNRYKPLALGIDCERCHGPGSFHVSKMEAGDEVDVGQHTDYSIVNPAKLPIDRQFDVCQQCHLQGLNVPDGDTEFRPGQALGDVRHVFLPSKADPNKFGIASHAERLRQSACFVASNGQLTCTKCHNPHETVHGSKSLAMNKICLSCHADNAKTCTVNPAHRTAQNDECAACHMPKNGTDDIPHVQFTDHRIRVVQSTAVGADSSVKAFFELHCATTEKVLGGLMGQAFVLYYEQEDARPEYLTQADSLLAENDFLFRAKLLYFQGKYEQALLPAAWAVVVSGFAPYPRRLWAQVLESAGRLEGARRAYADLYADYPGLTDAGLKVATLDIRIQGAKPPVLRQSRDLLLKLLALKPQDAQICTNLGFIYLNLSEFSSAELYLRKALASNPDHLPALENLVYLYSARGQATEARQAYDSYLQLAPDSPKLPALRKVLPS